jgi:hypothetical protein
VNSCSNGDACRFGARWWGSAVDEVIKVMVLRYLQLSVDHNECEDLKAVNFVAVMSCTGKLGKERFGREDGVCWLVKSSV